MSLSSNPSVEDKVVRSDHEKEAGLTHDNNAEIESIVSDDEADLAKMGYRQVCSHCIVPKRSSMY